MQHLHNQLFLNSESVAISDQSGDYSYNELNRYSDIIADHISEGQKINSGERVILFLEPGFNFLASLLGIWKAGCIAVPVFINAPIELINFNINDSQASLIIMNSFRYELKDKLSCKKILYIESIKNNRIVDFNHKLNEDALIIYTSGTTSKPKGVILTHLNILSQIKILTSAWHLSKSDVILNLLPLHHVHGLINALLCPIAVGAKIIFLKKFDPQLVWETFKKGEVNLFMAVPTIYSKLISNYELENESEKELRSKSLEKFRLMISGSAALPENFFNKWKKISAHTLLERYGMTEIGMAISNPYFGERKIGYVGFPLPEVQIRLIDTDDGEIITEDLQAGEIQVKSPSVFKYYWNRPEETNKAFTDDGWFKTGDMGLISDGYYKIIGRISSDIIKSAAYKISAIEIEEILREHEMVNDCAVIALPDEEWGEIVAACIITEISQDENFILKELIAFLKLKLPVYKLPRRWKILKELPRNALGKVMKKDLLKLF